MSTVRGDSLIDVMTSPHQAQVLLTTASKTVDTTDFGKLIVCKYAGTTTITLPTPDVSNEGFWVDICQTVDQTLEIACADGLIAKRYLASDKVSFATSNEKAGARARCEVIATVAGTTWKWLVTSLSDCTATVEADDS